MNAGVSLAAGGGAWDNLSDARMKTNFRDLDGDTVLAKLARIPIREWSYITQDASIRHVGPTAQDFHAAFGLGEDDRHISTLDPDGISLRAIQALDARTQRLQDENAALKAELAALSGGCQSRRAPLSRVPGGVYPGIYRTSSRFTRANGSCWCPSTHCPATPRLARRQPSTSADASSGSSNPGRTKARASGNTFSSSVPSHTSSATNGCACDWLTTPPATSPPRGS